MRKRGFVFDDCVEEEEARMKTPTPTRTFWEAVAMKRG